MYKKFSDKILAFSILLLLVVASPSTLGQTAGPVSGAKVEVYGDNGYAEAETKTDGTFLINEGLGTGTYTVHIEGEGFITAEIRRVSIEANGETDLGDIVLEPSGVVRGRVVDPDGNPVGRVTVLIETSTGDMIETTIAASDGRFEFNTNLETGSYTIRAMPFSFEGFEFREVNLGFLTISVPFPKKSSVFQQGFTSGARKGVSVTQGEVTENVEVRLSLSGIVSGRVTDEEGKPIDRVIVSAFQPSFENELNGFFAVTDDNGEYRIANNLPTSTYNVSLLFPKGYVWSFNQAIKVDVEAGEEVKNVDFVLERSGAVSGVVVYSNDLPAPNATVIATSEDGEYFGFTQTGIDGTFLIDSGLGTGKYNVMAVMEEGFAMPVEVDVQAGEEVKDVKLTLQTTGLVKAVVEGVVRNSDRNPVSDATVNAYGSSTPTDENGRYKLVLILPSGTETLEVEITASARGFEEQSKAVTVTAGEAVMVDFTLDKISSGILKGRILGEGIVIEKVTPNIRISLSETSAQVGDSITISGGIDPFKGDTEVFITVTGPSITEDYRVSTTDGDFSYTINVNAEGTWSVTVKVPSGDIYNEATSESLSFSVSAPAEEEEKKCIIATVTFGSEVAPEVDLLRSFRDNLILSTDTGSSFYVAFDAFYYSWSTPVARFIEANSFLKPIVKAYIYPLLGILSLTAFLSMPLFSIAPEAGAVIAGFVTSSLIGIVYFTPLLIMAHIMLKRRGFNLEIKGRTIKIDLLIVTSTLLLILLGYASRNSSLTTVATSAYVLSVVSLASLAVFEAFRKKYL